jgi:phytanoyl-CoA dioxygenase PhyH
MIRGTHGYEGRPLSMFQLTDSQTQSLHDQGYVVIPKVIPKPMIDAALKAINHSIGSGMDPERIDEFYKKSFCPELCERDVITDLINRTSARQVIESALGQGKVLWPTTGQLALRFPTMRSAQRPRPHIDGMYGPRDNQPGTLTNFTAVVGVQLSDLPATGMGNIAIWPGTHLRCAQYFREHGETSLYQGMPPIELAEPIQLTCNAGDIVLMHYLLLHGITTNHSPHVRYTAYYRIKHVNHDAQKHESMTSPWLHWEGLHRIASVDPARVVSAPAPARARSVFGWLPRRR